MAVGTGTQTRSLASEAAERQPRAGASFLCRPENVANFSMWRPLTDVTAQSRRSSVRAATNGSTRRNSNTQIEKSARSSSPLGSSPPFSPSRVHCREGETAATAPFFFERHEQATSCGGRGGRCARGKQPNKMERRKDEPWALCSISSELEKQTCEWQERRKPPPR